MDRPSGCRHDSNSGGRKPDEEKDRATIFLHTLFYNFLSILLASISVATSFTACEPLTRVLRVPAVEFLHF